MLPGSMKSAVRAPGVGLTTVTTSALLRVAFTASASSVCRWMRGTMPMTSRTARPNRPRRVMRRAGRPRRRLALVGGAAECGSGDGVSMI